MSTISYEQFTELDIRIGMIIDVKHVQGSKKLLKMVVDFGSEHRTILAGIAPYVEDVASLIGVYSPFIVNMMPRTIMGEQSEGMMLAVDSDSGPVLLQPQKAVSTGAKVR